MKKPVVSIIGRPNVGKSTLFNRIVRKREAIVDDLPGVTRDRKTMDAEWEGVHFTLVDTGGYVPDSKDAIESGVAKQVAAAMQEADLVLFLVEVGTGITEADGRVAKMIRKGGKPCVLAVNKVDDAEKEIDAAEFNRLGLGEPVMVSAQTGRSVGDLLSEVVGFLGESAETDEEAGIRLAVVGKPNVGKSTFINSMLGEERLLVNEMPGTTRDSVDVRFEYKGRSIVLVDTAGLRKTSRVQESIEFYSTLRTRRAIEACDVACVFLDASQSITQQDLRVLNEVIEAKKGVLLAINKWDLVEKDAEALFKLEELLDLRLEGMDFVPMLRISCKTGYKLDQVLPRVLAIYKERKKRVPPKDLVEALDEINNKYQHPAIGGRRIRIKYVTQVGSAPPRIAFFTNHPGLISDAYRKFLENRLRDKFGFEGVPLTLLFKQK